MQRGGWLTGPHHQVGVCLTRGVVCEGRGLQGLITRWVCASLRRSVVCEGRGLQVGVEPC